MILGTEVNEFVSNRQQSKIHYLQEENKQLQEYIIDLENALKLNKQAMALTMDGMNKRGQTSDSSTMSMCYTNYQNSQLEGVIKLLNEENEKLMKGFSNQQKIAQQLQTKLLLQEQISEEQQNYYKDLIGDLEYKLIDLKRNIHDKEYAIQELERMKPIQEREGQLVKSIEIVTPSEQNLKLHEELENVRNLLNKITTEAQSITETNNTLREVNYVQSQSNQIAFEERNLQNENSPTQLNELLVYERVDFVFKEFLDKTDDNLDLNREVQNHRGKLESLHQELYGTNGLGYGFSPEPQQLKYLSKNERMIYQEKLHKMEMMVKGFKELFEKEKNANIHIRQLYNTLLSKYESILDTNELIIKSNQLKDERNEKQQIELHFYKKQTQSLMEQLRNRKTTFNSIVLNQEQDIAVNIFSPRFQQKTQPNSQQSSTMKTQQQKINECDIKSSSKDLQQQHNQSQQAQKQQNVITQKPILPQLEINDSSSEEHAKYICQTARGDTQQLKKLNYQQQQGQILQYYDMTKQECIGFLMSMFNDYFKKLDFSNVKKLQLMKQIEEKPLEKKGIKRSYSNPFLYFSNTNNIAFNQPPKQSVVAITKNEIQLLLAELQSKKQHKNDHQEFGNDLFSVDVSKIDIKQNKKRLIDNDLSFISNFEQQD
ncbi:unnamed protein product (macronuclear) [Paramecium tetraurelia]|uniref:GRIP domain-containing protein n=1 Tax=Paramecium tetraurelia TaxID=5888 RepID=A0EF08_PARTE|nr:uncharacterized protein GSPATT00026222001 [Paramecium tetraurelia]CAK93899.1 unnamed protein product [Paramecium tetraurelia]|eukprot:XP_001461272.1 hypothetical protein (macronuclear) [Paramecium tetraurelia strain d4-2]